MKLFRFALAAGFCFAALASLAGEPAKPPAPPPPPTTPAKTPTPPATPTAPATPPPVAPALPKGAVLYFNFDQSEPAGNVSDKSGNKNNGHLSGAKWASAGRFGGGCEFTAKNDCIQVADSDSLHMKHATFIAWFKTAKADPVWRRLLDKRVDRGFALCIGGDAAGMQSKGKVAFTVNGCTPCLSDNTVTDGNWHHAAATYDGENLRLYVDGVPQKSVVPLKGEIVTTHEPLTIGLNRYNPTQQEQDNVFDGALDEVAIFNRVLTAEEIKALVPVVVADAAPGTPGKPKFTKQQVAGRLRELKYLFEQGLLTEDFYARKVAECEASQ